MASLAHDTASTVDTVCCREQVVVPEAAGEDILFVDQREFRRSLVEADQSSSSSDSETSLQVVGREAIRWYDQSSQKGRWMDDWIEHTSERRGERTAEQGQFGIAF